MAGRSRTVIFVSADPSVAVVDDAAWTENERTAGISIDGIDLRLGRNGIATDEELISVTDRLTAACVELRSKAVARLSGRNAPRDAVVCESPVCPIGLSHFIGVDGCSSSLRTAVA